MSDELNRLKQALADRYLLERELGAGGMATVYLADDLKHHRKVAIKVLKPALAHTIGVERFLREVEVIARLQHPHVLTLIDSGAIDGVPYYVMPFVEGQSLEVQVRGAGPLPVTEAVAIVREVADGLHYAHQHGVVHRDIKPGNILMSGGHSVIADFGIAMALDQAALGRITETGISLGSPVYMSPEQAAGERQLDSRTDIYSLGCVLYELLTGTPPTAEGSLQAVVTQKMLGEFRSARDIRPDIPAGVDAALTKALATQPAQRFADAKEFSDALAEGLAASVVSDEARAWKTARRRGRLVAGLATGVALVLLGVVFARGRARAERLVWAAQQLGTLELLASTGQYAKAFALGEELQGLIPKDTGLKRLRPAFTGFIPVRTTPAAAMLYRQSYDAPADKWEFLGVTPVESLPVPRLGSELAMRLKVEAAGYRTVEFLPNAVANWAVWRGVPPIDTIRLDKEAEIPPGMVRIPGFSMRKPGGREIDSLHFKDYFLSRYEVTNREYQEFIDTGGYRTRDYWDEPIVKEGHEISWEQAMAEFTDETGRPGPSTWRLGTYPEGLADFPVGGVSFYEAGAYARFRRMALPTAFHWEGARRFNRETVWLIIPRSNLNGTGPRAVGAERSMDAFGTYDMAGNMREWLVNPMEGGRLTLGAAWTEAEFEVGWRIAKPAFDRAPTLGIRLMQHLEGDTSVAHASGKVEVTTERDYRNARPVGETEYEVFRRLYAYDPAPLKAAVQNSGSSAHYDWQKVAFDAAYGGERAGAYLFLPKGRTGPYQSVIVWLGSGAMTEKVLVPENVAARALFLARSGRAMVIPLFKGSFERDDETFSTTISVPDRSIYFRDLAIQWIKDLGRTIDYLQSRNDLDGGRIGFLGISWGGQIAPIALALEPRIKAAVLDIGGLWVYGPGPLPEVDPLNFLPRVKTPVIMLNGEYDVVFPLKVAQEPFYRLLGTPAKDKQHVVFPAGHYVPQDSLISKALSWYDRYLGVPETRR